MPRSSSACLRCRRRKQKCDLRYPVCSNCKSARVQCLTYDAGKQAEVPRNYLLHLEEQVTKLTQENQGLRQQALPGAVDQQDIASSNQTTSIPTEIPSTPDGRSTNAENLVKSLRNTVVESSNQPRFLGPSSGITLARMVVASVRMDATTAVSTIPSQVTEALEPAESAVSYSPSAGSSLPPRQAADHLVSVYFQYRTPHMPIIQECDAKKAIDNAYLSLREKQVTDRAAEKDIFTTFMILAIALCNVPSPTGGTGRPLQSEGCFRSAICWVEKVITYSESELETLRAVLLLAQFVSMCPWRGSLWHLTGIALRLCIDLGLHWETEEQALNQSPDILYERRRLWYSAYQFDRVLGITLGRPFGVNDESTQVPLPNPWAVSRRIDTSADAHSFDTHHQRAHNHLFSMALLESEIRHVQHGQSRPAKPAYPRPNYKQWMQDIEPRLKEWFSTVPATTSAHPSSIFAHKAYWDTIYNNAVLLLHRPGPTSQQNPPEVSLVLYDAACKLIASIKLLQRDGRLDVLWKSAHDLFMAGLTVIYCVWQSASVRSLHSTSKIIASLQSCSSTLSAMSQNFSGVVGCRDAFDTLLTATLDWLLTNDVESPSTTRQTFERQVGDVLDTFQVPIGFNDGVFEAGTNDISMMLSSKNFAFGQMLSSAAQWPDLDNFEFDVMDMDLLPTPRMDLGGFTALQSH